jgi:hypothetical protein
LPGGGSLGVASPLWGLVAPAAFALIVLCSYLWERYSPQRDSRVWFDKITAEEKDRRG